MGDTATVGLSHARPKPTGFDVSLRPARAAQIVYTLTAIPQIRQVLIKVNGIERAAFVGSKLALEGALEQQDMIKPIRLPTKPGHVPRGARGVHKLGREARCGAGGRFAWNVG
jgi:hypothetical protein